MDAEDYVSGSDVDSDIEEGEIENGKVSIPRNRSIEEDIDNENVDEDDLPNDEEEEYNDEDEEENNENIDIIRETKNENISENIKTFYLSDEDDESDDENYLQKFQENIQCQIESKYFP